MIPHDASIIFVDDDANVLRGLRRRMMGQRPNWSLRFFESAEEALVGLDECEADVVISDMRMPSMDGAEFLRIVASRYPQTSRILLSGYADEIAIQNGTAATQHFLTKPCKDTEIIHAVERGLIMRSYLRDPILVDLLAQLPEDLIWPRSFQRLHTILQFSGQKSRDELAEFALAHPFLTELAFQLANREQLVAPDDTVELIRLVNILGIETIKALCVLWSECGRSEKFDPENIDIELHRPLVLGQMAARLARKQNLSFEQVDHIRAAALLCHIGQVIIKKVKPDGYDQSRRRADNDQCDIISAEIAEMGFAHPAVSACICAYWGFPHEIVENIAFHHRPEAAPTPASQSLLIVYAAQHFARKAGIDGAKRAPKYDLASSFITRCGAEGKWPSWEHDCITNHIPRERISH